MTHYFPVRRNSISISFKNIRHSRAGGNPVLIRRAYFGDWIPTCAGMTVFYFTFRMEIELDVRGETLAASVAAVNRPKNGHPLSIFSRK
jgi:hypothetical protein